MSDTEVVALILECTKLAKSMSDMIVYHDHSKAFDKNVYEMMKAELNVLKEQIKNI